MRLQEYTDGETHIMQLAGEIDLHYAPIMRSLLRGKATAECPALILDLTELRFIDSSGLATLIEYLREATRFGGRFCVGGMSPEVGWIFETTQLDKVMPLFASVAEAKAALARGATVPERQLFEPVAA